MSEEIGAFVGFELLQRIGGGSFECIEGSRSGLAHMRLKLCEGVFDRIEVGTVGRQLAEFGTAGFNSLPDTCDFVGGQIVHDDDVVGAQRWRKHLLDPGRKDSSSIGPSRSIGATKPASVKPVTKVVVFQ